MSTTYTAHCPDCDGLVTLYWSDGLFWGKKSHTPGWRYPSHQIFEGTCPRSYQLFKLPSEVFD